MMQDRLLLCLEKQKQELKNKQLLLRQTVAIKHITVRAGNAEDSYNQVLVDAITILVNEAYRVGEMGLFEDPWQRTNQAEIKALLQGQATCGGGRGAKTCLLLAESNSLVVGCVRASMEERVLGTPMSNSTAMEKENVGQFGMLAVATSAQGLGVGNLLASAAESWCATASFMEIDLVTPRGWHHPHKDGILRAWYARLGYKKHSSSTQLLHKGLKPPCVCPVTLKVDCNMELHRKQLVKSAMGTAKLQLPPVAEVLAAQTAGPKDIASRFRADGFVIIQDVFTQVCVWLTDQH